MKKVWDREYDMAVGDPGEQATTDEIDPAVGVGLGAGEAESGLAGKGDASCIAAVGAAILGVAHFFRVAAVEHFLNGNVVVGGCEPGMDGLEGVPVVAEDLFEGGFVDMFRRRHEGTA